MGVQCHISTSSPAQTVHARDFEFAVEGDHVGDYWHCKFGRNRLSFTYTQVHEFEYCTTINSRTLPLPNGNEVFVIWQWLWSDCDVSKCAVFS